MLRAGRDGASVGVCTGTAAPVLVPALVAGPGALCARCWRHLRGAARPRVMERDQREGRILLPRLKRLRGLGDPKRDVPASRRKDLAGH